ncbi:MAG: hypothetical protein AB1465_00210 [Patescibacteria group bacterium]
MTEKKYSFKKILARIIIVIIIFFIFTGFLFIISEFSYRLFKVIKLVFEKTYSVKNQAWREYDPLLGWINKPSTDISIDLGEGKKHVFIDSYGFRNTPKNHVYYRDLRYDKIIALGDSFTFGYGVNNDETWPFYLEKQLRAKDRKVQVINMGCTAYGLDQEFLWFRRDGLKFKSKIVILGLLDISFSRATLSRWIQGENKPKFKISNGKLILANIPVPKPSRVGSIRISKSDIPDILFNWRGSYIMSFLRDRFYRLNLLFMKKLPECSESFYLGKALLRELNLLCNQNNIKLIILLIPKREWENNLPAIYYSMKDLKNELSIDIIDTIELFNADNLKWQYLYDGSGHFSAEGNKIVANYVYEYLAKNNFFALYAN